LRTYLKIRKFVQTISNMKVVSYTDLRVNLKKWLDLVINDVEELIIKRKNNKDLVVISLDEYNALKETAYLLSGKNRDVLIRSIQEAKEGNTQQQDLLEE
jgi:antitoxin YefM